MKKVIFVLLVIALLIVGYTHDQFVWCKKLLFGEPTTHVIQKGEYLSTIAKQYYGRADYWKELALINRAPDSDLIHPGEEIIVPSLNVIKEIRRTRWLSKVNSYVKNEEDVIARLNRGEQINLAENKSNEPKTKPEMMAETDQNEAVQAQEPISPSPTQIAQQNNEPQHAGIRSTTSSGLTLGVIALILAASVFAFVMIRRKKRSQPIAIVDDHELNLLGDDDESEPDYHEYLQKKSRRKEDVLGRQK